MKKVLVVEDDLPTQKLYNTKLSKEGFEVYSASTGPEALTILSLQVQLDLVLLDIMLPGSMNGFDVLKKIKENDSWNKIPVIMLTNLDTEKDAALRDGVVEYIVKANTSLADLVNTVRKYT